VRITPLDLEKTSISDPAIIHFICSPTRANVIVQELKTLDWKPIAVYEPIPYRCVPEELPALKTVLPNVDVLRYAGYQTSNPVNSEINVGK
jgi:hypothetical protein